MSHSFDGNSNKLARSGQISIVIPRSILLLVKTATTLFLLSIFPPSNLIWGLIFHLILVLNLGMFDSYVPEFAIFILEAISARYLGRKVWEKRYHATKVTLLKIMHWYVVLSHKSFTKCPNACKSRILFFCGKSLNI